MVFHLLPPLSSFLLLVAVAAEFDRKSALPNTPLPKAMRNLLVQPGGSSINAQKEDANSVAGYNAVYETSNYNKVYENPKIEGESSTTGYDAVNGTAPKTGGNSYNAVYGTPRKTEGSSYDAVYGSARHAGESSVDENPQKAAGESSPDPGGDDGSALNVFLEKDMHPGTKMTVIFTKTSNASHFLPRQVAESIPFSSNNLPEILNRFSLKDNSAEAKTIENTIKECEKPAMKGEDKYCARSLESLIDFSTSRLGKNIRVVPNVVESENQEYEFEEGVEKLADKSVVCHQLNYPYAVALCHVFEGTKIYKVPLVGGDGSRVKALTVCHEDTSGFAPDALALRLLNVKPGALPICHFLPNGHFVWVPK